LNQTSCDSLFQSEMWRTSTCSSQHRRQYSERVRISGATKRPVKGVSRMELQKGTWTCNWYH